jgi:hypothetical protein
VPDVGSIRPGVNPRFHPVRNRHRSHVAAFADEVRDYPMLFAPLDRLECQTEQLCATQPAADEHRMIAEFAQRRRNRVIEQPSALFGSEPVPETEARATDAFDAADAGGEFGAQESGVGGFVRDATDRRQS